ncbi:unnamed protein product [Heligmosomoides polygyrus]|uniref:DnaJ_C domain-containing protein n=1 Tax=Heligmosomoides polygyrus TaxID=6339 RepID=A0A183G5C4_HELPZ|nr:unnamed protein product [Heligmosomoides polygyrus]
MSTAVSCGSTYDALCSHSGGSIEIIAPPNSDGGVPTQKNVQVEVELTAFAALSHDAERMRLTSPRK